MLVRRSLRAACADDSDARVDEMTRAFQRHYARHCLDHTRVYPGLERVVHEMRCAGKRLAVLTNKPRTFSEQILSGLGLRDAFETVLGGDDLPTKKPDPAGLDWILDDVGCDVGQAVLVGDSDVDIETARNTGVAACAVTWGFRVPSKLSEARFVARRPDDLLSIV